MSVRHIAGVLLAWLMTACSGPSAEQARSRLAIRGSDTMVILMQRWAEAYMDEHPDVVLQISGGGSGTGIAALIDGTTDLATASRPMTDRERALVAERRGRPAVIHPVATDAIAIYVHQDNPVESLSSDELAGVFRGRVATWDELGGAARPIARYGRESSSGTYAFFKQTVLRDLDFAAEVQSLPGTAAVIHAVSRDEIAVGYGGVGYGENVRRVPLRLEDGRVVAPTAEATAAGDYPLARPLYIISAGEPQGLAADLLAFTRSPQGQRLVEAAGYFPWSGELREEAP